MAGETRAEQRLREIADGFYEEYPNDTDACDIGREAIAIIREQGACVCGLGDNPMVKRHAPQCERRMTLLTRAGRDGEGSK